MRERAPITLAFNLGGSQGPYHGFPFFFEFEEMKEAIDFFRQEETLDSLFEIAHRAGSTPRNMTLWARFDNSEFFWEFKIAMKNMNYTITKDYCVSRPKRPFSLDSSTPVLDFSSLIWAPCP